ncbi:MAG: MiaB/RimO family radical SAM methylthiotransferase, partial [Clostridia bacterium]|nr:MiaB/RimO family radical SAM methylthiotransferase [Clostridia bacterium]
VDYICGNTDKLSVADAALRLLSNGKKNSYAEHKVNDIENAPFERMSITKFERTRAYIKIEDGCESRCTYCIIPSARGKIRSKPLSDVIDEVTELVRGGCREIVLTGIETASYGRDLGDCDLATLLEEVDKIPNIGRVRLGSLDPSLITPAFVRRIAPLKSLAPHFHLSLQSGSSRILALMKRKYNAEMAMRGIELLRAEIPDVKFTTDVIVGFPGETEEDFAQTVDFAKRAKFLMMHIFPYSKRAGTPAALMTNQVSTDIKHRRAAELGAVAKKIRSELLLELVAQVPVKEVLFETYRDGIAYGHTADFVEVSVASERPMHSEFHYVRILGTNGELCTGTLISDLEVTDE